MGETAIKQETGSAEEDGSLAMRFRNVIAGRPSIMNDVVMKGSTEKNLRKEIEIKGESLKSEFGFWVSDGKIPYQVVMLHRGNIDDETMSQMFTLQDSIAKHKEPHPENLIDYKSPEIDYKSPEEVKTHFENGGVGLGIYTAYGRLIGQILLSFGRPAAGPFAKQDEPAQANIDWLMVDRAYSRNSLCFNLMGLAVMMAESVGMKQLRANVRLINERGFAKFSANGFIGAGTDLNEKDASLHIRMFRKTGAAPVLENNGADDMITLEGMRTDDRRLALFKQLTARGYAAVWSNAYSLFTFQRIKQTGQPHMRVVKPGV